MFEFLAGFKWPYPMVLRWHVMKCSLLSDWRSVSVGTNQHNIKLIIVAQNWTTRQFPFFLFYWIFWSWHISLKWFVSWNSELLIFLVAVHWSSWSTWLVNMAGNRIGLGQPFVTTLLISKLLENQYMSVFRAFGRCISRWNISVCVLGLVSLKL